MWDEFILARSKDFNAVFPIVLTANLYTSGPSIWMKVKPSSMRWSLATTAVPPAGIHNAEPPVPSAPKSTPLIP